MIVPVLNLLVGIAALLLGRKLYWLFIGVAGFALGVTLTTRLLGDRAVDWVILVVGLVIGLIGALIAIFLQRIAVGLAGFLAGAYLVVTLLDTLSVESNVLSWVLLFVGGIIGALIAAVLFDWALIILSSLTGASLIVQSLPWTQIGEWIPWSFARLLAFVLLAVVGIAFQAGLFRREQA